MNEPLLEKLEQTTRTLIYKLERLRDDCYTAYEDMDCIIQDISFAVQELEEKLSAEEERNNANKPD